MQQYSLGLKSFRKLYFLQGSTLCWSFPFHQQDWMWDPVPTVPLNVTSLTLDRDSTSWNQGTNTEKLLPPSPGTETSPLEIKELALINCKRRNCVCLHTWKFVAILLQPSLLLAEAIFLKLSTLLCCETVPVNWIASLPRNQAKINNTLKNVRKRSDAWVGVWPIQSRGEQLEEADRDTAGGCLHLDQEWRVHRNH